MPKGEKERSAASGAPVGDIMLCANENPVAQWSFDGSRPHDLRTGKRVAQRQ
jgi:hypothetical protein